MPCANCDDAACSGEVNKLRAFTGWDDLCAHASEDLIVQWVNKLDHLLTMRREASRKTAKRYSLGMKLLKEHLDPDELQRLADEAGVRVNGQR